MKYLKTLTGALVMSCGLMLTTHSFAAGQILFGDIEGDIEKGCSVPAEPGVYYFRAVVGCRSDDYNALSFNNVDSALTVSVFDDRNCEDENGTANNWTFSVTTVKQPTTIGTGTGAAMEDWIMFRDIWLTANNAVVVPGVIKTRHSKRGDPNTIPNLHNEASCVRVSRE